MADEIKRGLPEREVRSVTRRVGVLSQLIAAARAIPGDSNAIGASRAAICRR